MTMGHVEIQAVKEAVQEVSNAVVSMKNWYRKLPARLSYDQQTVLHKDLESVSRDMFRFSDCLASLSVRRKAELVAIGKDGNAAAETLRSAEEMMEATEAMETGLVANIEAIDHDKSLRNERRREVAIETREKLVGGRERRVNRSRS